jgi:hypothetical protein
MSFAAALKVRLVYVKGRRDGPPPPPIKHIAYVNSKRTTWEGGGGGGEALRSEFITYRYLFRPLPHPYRTI